MTSGTARATPTMTLEYSQSGGVRRGSETEDGKEEYAQE